MECGASVSKSQYSPGDLIRFLVNGLPHGPRENRLLLMLQGYIDDSGSDGTRIPFVLAGYILAAEKWADFSDAWKSELERKPRIKYFKMNEAVSGDGQFKGLSEEFRKCKVRDLIAIINRYKPSGICVFAKWDEWKQLIEPYVPRISKYPYTALFMLMLDAVVSYEKSIGIFPEKIQLDFDEQGDIGRLTLQWYSIINQFFHPDLAQIISRTPTMLNDKEYVALQAADLLAWAIRRDLDPTDKIIKGWEWVYSELRPTVWGGPGLHRKLLQAVGRRSRNAKTMRRLRQKPRRS